MKSSKKIQSNNSQEGNKGNRTAIDSISVLLPELFPHLLSFLPPSGVATSSAVSRDWRTLINSDFSLHQEIDLSNLGLGSNPDQITNHLQRLSALAHQRVIKLSLNLSSYWLVMVELPQTGDLESGPSLMLLYQTSRPLRTIKRVKVKIDKETAENTVYLSSSFMEAIVNAQKEPGSSRSLESVEVQAPLVFSLQGGGFEHGKKMIKISNLNRMAFVEEDVIDCVERIMQIAHDFLECGLNEFILPERQAGGETIGIERSSSFLNELSNSRSTLQTLDLSGLEGVDGRNF